MDRLLVERGRTCAIANILALFSIGAGLVLAPCAFAQTFPSKPIRLVTAGAPGSVPDTVARPLAEKLAAEFQHPVVVENRPGAGGIVAMNLVAKARPDGYTLGLVSIAQMVFNLYLFDNLSYDPVHELTPVIKLVAGQAVVAAHPSFPADSVGGLIALVKAQPGTIHYAVPQLGAPPHIFALMLSHEAQIDMVAVPFRGAHEALASVVAGNVPVLFDASLIIAPHVKAGKLKALAVTGRERDRLLPGTPTLAESGLPNVHGEAWIGLAAPANLSPATISKINDAVSRALRAPDLRQHYEDQGWQIVGGSSTDFASAIRADHAIWGRIIRESGLKLN